MNETNGGTKDDGAGGVEAPWQLATRGRHGTGRERGSGRGSSEGNGDNGATGTKNDNANDKNKEKTEIHDIVDHDDATKTNEQDGDGGNMDAEPVNTQKKRSHSFAEEKEQTTNPAEGTKDNQNTTANKTGITLDYSDKAATNGKSVNGPFAHLTKEEAQAMMKARGENMIEENGEMETQMKIEFNIGNDVTQYPVRHNAVKVLAKMKSIDPAFAVKSPTDTTIWRDLSKLPTNDEFGKHFNIREDTSPRGPRKIVMHCKMISKKKIGDIKFDANLIHFLRENKIWLVVDKFDMRRLGSPGFFIDMHPRLTNLANLNSKLRLVMKRTQLKDKTIMEEWKSQNPTKATEDMESKLGCYNPIPDFHLQSGRRAFGVGDARVETDCLIVQSAADDATYLKALLSSVYENQAFTRGMFVPAGIHLIEGPKILCNLLRRHNKFLQESTAITLFGMSTDSLDSPITLDSGEVLDLKEFLIQYSPGITGIEETNKTESDGKWFIMTKKTKVNEVTEFLDKHLKEIYQQFVNDEDLIPNFPYPRRTPATTSRSFKPANTTVGTYSSVLQAYASNPQEDGPSESEQQYNKAPERPRKRQAVQILFDNHKDFPELPATSTTPAPSVTPTSTTMSHTTNVDQKLADMEKRIQHQIATLTAHQDAQMKNMQSQFNTSVQQIMQGLNSLMTNAQQLGQTPSPPIITFSQSAINNSSHVGSKVNTNMSSSADQVENSQAGGAQN